MKSFIYLFCIYFVGMLLYVQTIFSTSVNVETYITDEKKHITNILIPITEDTKTAVFQRNGYVYIILDRSMIEPLSLLDHPVIQEARIIPSNKGTILRFLLNSSYTWYIDRRGRYLILALSLEKFDDKVIPIYPIKKENTLSFEIEETTCITFKDPVSGEKIYAFPLLLHEQKMPFGLGTETFELPETDQGLILIPHIASINTSYKDKKLILTSNQDLLLNDKIAFISPHKGDVLDFSEIKALTKQSFYKEKNRLQDLIVSMPEAGEAPFKKALARLYLSQNLALEAENILKSIKNSYRDEEVNQLTAVSLLAQGKIEEVNKQIVKNPLSKNSFAYTLNNFIQSPALLSDDDIYNIYNTLPTPLFISLSFQAIPHLIEYKKTNMISFILSKIHLQDLNSYQKQAFYYYAGQLALLRENDREARLLFNKALEEKITSPAAFKSDYHLTLIDLKENNISFEQAIKKLENLRFSYQDQTFEEDILNTLYHLYHQNKNYINALKTYRSLFIIHPDSQKTREMINLFKEAMLNDENMPPLEKVSLFYEFKELIPSDVSGNQIMESLIDNLIDLDLLNQAFDISLSLARYRFKGQKQQDFYFKAALIALLNRKIDDAKNVLYNLQEGSSYQKSIYYLIQKEEKNKNLIKVSPLRKEELSFLNPILLNYLEQQELLQ